MTASGPGPGLQVVDGKAVMSPPAEITIASSNDLRGVLADAIGQYGTVIVDMRANEHCASSGMSALVGAAKRARAAGGDVLLVLTRLATRRIFKVTAASGQA